MEYGKQTFQPVYLVQHNYAKVMGSAPWKHKH